MVLDVHTQTFHDARNDILDLKSKGALNKETFNNYMKLKGIDPQDFVNANETFVGIKRKLLIMTLLLVMFLVELQVVL